MIEETPLPLFYNCIKTKLLWDQLKDFISNETLFFPSTLFYSFLHLNIEYLKAIIDKTKRTEEEISKHELKKRSKYLMKWRPFTDDLV